MSASFEQLFSPLQLGRLRLANRIVSTAHGVRLAQEHAPSQRDIDYYLEKARGGVGMIVQEAIRVHPTTVPSPGSIVGYDRAKLPRLRALADAVHGAGTPLVGQICHQGRQTSSAYMRQPLWAPSAIPGYFNHETPHAMDADEIRTVVRAHADSARLVVEAGYDGIEVHAGHGYLLQEFLSPLSNRRTDCYGGSLENRARLLREVVEEVRAAAGEALLGLRISVEEFLPGGLVLEEACAALQSVLAVARLDYVSVTQSSYEGVSLSTMVPDTYVQPGAYVRLAQGVKAAVGEVPVLAVGRIDTPELAERVLRVAGVQLVGMTRAQIADPELARKAREGEAQRIRPCLALNVCWRTAVFSGMPITCAVNPTAGREAEWGAGTLPKAASPRRVIVVGGGPAGLEAARVLGAAGHHVVLIERTGELGGQLLLASKAPGRAALAKWPEWAIRELALCGVEVRLRTEATAEQLASHDPDAVVLASGSRGSLGDLHVEPGALACNARDVLAGERLPSGSVLVVDREWEWQAPSVAEHLAQMGHDVAVSTEKLHLGVRIPPNSLPTMLARLEERGIVVHSQLRALGFTGETVQACHSFTGAERELAGFQAVVIAGDAVAEDRLRGQLLDLCPVVLSVGDCVAPRQLVDAVFDGHAAARQLAERWA